MVDESVIGQILIWNKNNEMRTPYWCPFRKLQTGICEKSEEKVFVIFLDNDRKNKMYHKKYCKNN